MDNKFLLETGVGEYKVPINPDVYRKNLEYYSGMGIFPDKVCKEKALLVSGYRVIKPHDFDELYKF